MSTLGSKPILYTVIVTGHNLPNLFSVLAYKPQRVLLVASDTSFYLKQAERLRQQIVALLPEVKITLLNSHGLGGESLPEAQTWVEKNLLPFYEQHKTEFKWFLNVTGGTKILPMLFESLLPWDEIHYKALKLDDLQVWQFENGQRHFLPSPAHYLSVHLSPLEALQLYTEAKEGSLNRIDASEDSAAIAMQIWAFYEDYANTNIENVHTELSRVLNEVWENENHPSYAFPEVLIPWDEFDYERSELVTWIKRLAALSKQFPVCLFTEQGVTIPGNKLSGNSKATKYRKDWKKWVGGLWLETLMNEWAAESGVKFSRGVQVDEQTRELDLVTLHKQQLQVFEAKAAPFLKNGLSSIVRQIKSVQDIGMLQDYLVISPYFKKVVNNPERFDSFEKNCKRNGIKLITSEAEFLKCFTPL